MKKEYSQQEIKDILKSEVQIPDKVEEGLQEAYHMIGMGETVTMRYTKKHRWMVGFAAAAVLVMGTSVGVVAANKFLSVNLEEKDNKVGYHFQVDRSKEAHEIEVTPEYMPEGMKYQKEGEGPYGGKWHNDETGEGITIITYNASELDEMERMDAEIWLKYKKSDFVKTVSINDMKVDIFSLKNQKADPDRKTTDIYLQNEENGYLVQIYTDTAFSEDELLKIAEGLKVTVTDKVVPYKTDEELAERKREEEEANQSIQANYDKGRPADTIKNIGEELDNPFVKMNWEGFEASDVRFTVEGVEVRDSLPKEEFPKENYEDYETVIAPWVNEDGTLKSHKRYRLSRNEGDNVHEQEDIGIETASSKFVVVKMKAKNYSDRRAEGVQEISMAPDLMTLEKREDGSYGYTKEYFMTAEEGYALQWFASDGASFPVYYDDPYYTEGMERQKDYFLRAIQPGEEREYTLVYVVDEDQLGQMYLNCYPDIYGMDESMYQYVNISK